MGACCSATVWAPGFQQTATLATLPVQPAKHLATSRVAEQCLRRMVLRRGWKLNERGRLIGVQNRPATTPLKPTALDALIVRAPGSARGRKKGRGVTGIATTTMKGAEGAAVGTEETGLARDRTETRIMTATANVAGNATARAAAVTEIEVKAGIVIVNVKGTGTENATATTGITETAAGSAVMN
ncbi:hypothetical protein OH77DRAFT_440304 [Trametes cingulata]|nr:hypothetical protein OH77DRAFT_440304 [Trametes cingulata]